MPDALGESIQVIFKYLGYKEGNSNWCSPRGWLQQDASGHSEMLQLINISSENEKDIDVVVKVPILRHLMHSVQLLASYLVGY